MKFKKFVMFIFAPLFILSIALGGVGAFVYFSEQKSQPSQAIVSVGEALSSLDEYVVVADGVTYKANNSGAMMASSDDALSFDQNGKLNIVFVKGGDQTGTVAARLTAGTLVAETLADEPNQIASVISAEKTTDGIVLHTYDDKNNAIIEHSFDADYTFNQMITNTEDKLSYSNGAFEILSSSGVISLTAATTAQTAQVMHINGGTFTFSGGTYGKAKPASGTNTTVTNGRAFYVTGGSLTLTGVTIQNFANAENGGAVSSSGTSTISLNSGTTIRDCEAVNGGGVYKAGNGSLIINGATLTGNKANGGSGGAVYTAAPLTMTSGTISNNTAAKTGSSNTYGGGIRVHYANATISGGDFYGNSAIYGGGIHFSASAGNSLTFSNGHVYNNSATHGGGIGGSGACTINITGGVIGDSTQSSAAGTTAATRSNYATHFGGGVMIEAAGSSVGPTLNISGGTIAYNSASEGGGIYNHNIGTVNVTGGEIRYNRANSGGGIIVRCYDGSSAAGTLSMTDALVIGNVATINGGGIFCGVGATCTITDTDIISNSATSGGGICANNGATVTISSTTGNDDAHRTDIKLNTAVNGGGVYNNGTFIQNSSTDVGDWDEDGNGNTATENGGGVYNTGTYNMIGGYMECNTAAGNGGGVYNTGTFNNYGNIPRNSAANGGGVYNTGTFNMYDNEIYENEVSGNGGGVYTTGTFTIIDGDIDNNTATNYGGGVYIASGTFNFGKNISDDGMEIYDNTAKYGGGIACNEAVATIYLGAGEIAYNSAELGGACYFHYTQPGASSVTQYLNVYIDDDGDGTLRIHDNTATQPSSGDRDNGKGGAIYMNGRATRVYIGDTGNSEPQFYDNSADNNGGAIYTSNKAILTLNDGTFTGNNSGNTGGAIKNMSDYTVINGGTFGNNSSTGDSDGWIIHTEKNLTINDCNFTYTSGGNSPLCVYNGNTTINGGTFKLVKGDTGNNCLLSITGGTFQNLYVDHGNLTISDGTFNTICLEMSASKTINIYGGTFGTFHADFGSSLFIDDGTFGWLYCNFPAEIQGGTFRYIQLNDSATIENVTTGGIWLNSSSLTATISDSTINGWFEHEYGAVTATSCSIYNYEATEGASGTFTDCYFESYFHIQVESSRTGLTFDECTIDAQTFTHNGNTYSNYSRIGQYTVCPVTFTDCEIYRPLNVYAYASTFSLTLTGCTFSLTNPILYSDTAALFIEREPSYRTNNNSEISVNITDCTFQNITHNGVTIGGGAIRANWCYLEVDGCTFTNCSYNTSYGGGGAICVEDNCYANIYDTTFTNCTAKNGGAVAIYAGSDAVQFSSSWVCLYNSTFTNCSASNQGGALYSMYGSAGFDDIDGCTFTGCHATEEGGAIYTDTDYYDIDFGSYTSGGVTKYTTFTGCYTLDNNGTAIYANRGYICLNNVSCSYTGSSISEPLIYFGSDCYGAEISGGTFTNANGDCFYNAIHGSDFHITSAPTITASNGDGIVLAYDAYIGLDASLTSNITVYKQHIGSYANYDSDSESYTIAVDLESDTFSANNASHFSLSNGGATSTLTVMGRYLYVNTLYTITYNKNDGSGTTSTQTVAYGTTFTTKSSTEFTRTGYHITGWGSPYASLGTQYTYNRTTNTTLYAQWAINTYTVTLRVKSSNGTYYQGGYFETYPYYDDDDNYTVDYIGTSKTITGVQHGKALSINGINIWSFGTGDDINAVARSGYTFDGYYVGNTKISNGYQVTGDTTIDAVFANQKTITIVIDAHMEGIIRENSYNGTILWDNSTGSSATTISVTISATSNLYLDFEAPGLDGDSDAYCTMIKAGTSSGSSNLGYRTGAFSPTASVNFTINASNITNGMTIYISKADG